MERELTLTSQPEGALVYVSDVEVGRTPVTIPFTWYGDYDVIYRLEGYETLKTHAALNPPVYEIPPLDLLATVSPWTYRDHRYVNGQLSPMTMPSDDELIAQAKQMQTENAAGPQAQTKPSK